MPSHVAKLRKQNETLRKQTAVNYDEPRAFDTQRFYCRMHISARTLLDRNRNRQRRRRVRKNSPRANDKSNIQYLLTHV